MMLSFLFCVGAVLVKYFGAELLCFILLDVLKHLQPIFIFVAKLFRLATG